MIKRLPALITKGSDLKIFFVLAFAHVLVSAVYIHFQDITFDEGPYFGYTVRWAHGNMDRLYNWDDSKSPATFPALIPRAIYQVLNPLYAANDDGRGDILMGRYAMSIYTLLAGCYLFYWAKGLYGIKAATWATLFFLFSPLVISFSMLVLSDMASGAAVIATLYHLWRFYESRKKTQFILFACWLGYGIVVKASCFFLLPCLSLLLLILLLTKTIPFNPKKIFILSLLLCFLVVVVTNLFFGGIDSFVALKSYQFKSHQFKELSGNLNLFQNLPVPFPRAILEGWDLLQFNKEQGPWKKESTYGGVYILGKTHVGPVWYYYLFMSGIKFPISILILLVTGAWLAIIYLKKHALLNRHIFYLLPILFFLVILSTLNCFQSGLKHLLILYPLIMLCMAALFNFCNHKWKYTTSIFVVLFFWMIISQLFYFPNLIPYTNEFVWDKKNVYKITIDTNLDYEQYESHINTFLLKNPEYKRAPLQPSTGKFILPVNDVFEERTKNAEAYEWLLKLHATDHYKFCFLLFDVK